MLPSHVYSVIVKQAYHIFSCFLILFSWPFFLSYPGMLLILLSQGTL